MCNTITLLNQKKNRNNTYSFRENANFEKTWLSKLCCHGNINIDVHVTTTSKCSQINFRERPRKV